MPELKLGVHTIQKTSVSLRPCSPPPTHECAATNTELMAFGSCPQITTLEPDTATLMQGSAHEQFTLCRIGKKFMLVKTGVLRTVSGTPQEIGVKADPVYLIREIFLRSPKGVILAGQRGDPLHKLQESLLPTITPDEDQSFGSEHRCPISTDHLSVLVRTVNDDLLYVPEFSLRPMTAGRWIVLHAPSVESLVIRTRETKIVLLQPATGDVRRIPIRSIKADHPYEILRVHWNYEFAEQDSGFYPINVVRL